MSINSLYPGTTNGVCVTAIIKDKIREYMMGDSSNQMIKPAADVSTTRTKENSLLLHDNNIKKLHKQDPVSTTDLGLPSSLDVSIHNSSEPCPHKQDLITASVRRIGNSLDALLLESKKAAQAKPVKKSSTSISQQNTDRLFLSSEQVRRKKSVTLHDICEEYIQFITVNSSAAPDEETVTTTSESEVEKKRDLELKINPLGATDKRLAQISVITINENSQKNCNGVIKQSVEEMHVNECERSADESDGSTDKLVSGDSHDGLPFKTINGNMKSSSPADKNGDSITALVKVHEKDDKKEEPVVAEVEDSDKIMVSLSNGVSHDVNDDIEEEDIEEADEHEQVVEQSSENEEEKSAEKYDEKMTTKMNAEKDSKEDTEVAAEIESPKEEKDEVGTKDDAKVEDEVAEGKNDETIEHEKKVVIEEENLVTEPSTRESFPANVKLEADTEIEQKENKNVAKKDGNEEEEEEEEKEQENKTKNEEVNEDTKMIQNEEKGKKHAGEEMETDAFDTKIKEKNINQILEKESLVAAAASIKETVNNNTTTAVIAGVKRKADTGSNEELEQDRDGGISSSSSCSGSEADNAQDCKRIRFDESIFEEDERERLIREFVERSTESSEEIGKNCSKLTHEIAALSDLARAKELEWNSIMRLLKLKEEMLERILFKKRHLDSSVKSDLETSSKMYKNFVSSSTPVDHNKINRHDATPLTSINNHVTVVPVGVSNAMGNGALHSSSPQEFYKPANASILAIESLNKMRPNRPILPKPPPLSLSSSSSSSSPQQQQPLHVPHPQQLLVHSSQSSSQPIMSAALLMDQNSIIGEGRQGPILDVKSIIAEYRSKNPDSLPRRGRRNLPFGSRIPDCAPGPRFLGNTALLSMANMALGSGSHVRTSVSSTTHNDHRPSSFLMGSDVPVPAAFARSELQMRHPNIDSLMLSVSAAAAASNSSQTNNSSSSISSNCHTSSSSGSNNVNNNNSFQEALVKFAKMNEKRDISSSAAAAALHLGGANKNSHLPPPPPYPEVTLHPVLVPQSSGSPPVQNSLLHGILTKSNVAVGGGQHHPNNNMNNANVCPTSINSIHHRPTTFSPTLARLLTAPERNRARSVVGSSNRSTKSTLSEILNSKKARTEVTITPVTTSTVCSSKSGSDVVLVDDDDESENADRLVIDEGRGEVVTDAASNVIPADQVPECQGCHKKAAQFVCAGCGNQWYCSRECQVQAWEDHSEMCSG